MDNILERPDIKMALDDTHAINQGKYLWAKFHMYYSPRYSSVRVSIGQKGAKKEIASHHIDYILLPDKSVYKSYMPGL